ncbi:sugar ABC transporter permease [Streptomyces sp. MP131-18]|uniref:carbohydrate ABC transporter permease n=1 Tax=Streptomyces sp. MP131-18 TaxID=1857892 RepID=UPI0009A23CBF|nr:sugar ABC transporter permease [Streptomyces sp. MP131-18]ONK11867.1 L-arabinose transport system permease protein AraP [Streptomyces sp. MP131-18]
MKENVAGGAGRAAERLPRPATQQPIAVRGRGRRAAGDNRAAYAFLTPWLIGMAVFTIGPMLFSLYLAFTRYDLSSAPEWIGLDNFRRMFTTDPRFFDSVDVTLTYVLWSVPLLLAVSLGLAMLLNRGMRFLTGYRALFYMPSLIGGSVAVAALWRQIFGEEGIVNKALAAVGIDHGSWVGDPGSALYTIVVLQVWTFGSAMVIFLAGLRQIPQELYDAAAVDGAGPVRRFRSVTLPMLSPLVFFNLLLSVVNAFQAFTGAYVVSNGTGGPSDSTLFYTLYLYEQGFAQLNMGYAAAMAWVLVLGLAVFTGLLFLSSRYWVHYGDER